MIKGAITIVVDVEVVVISEHIQLNVGRPIVHNLGLPRTGASLSHKSIDPEP